MGSFNTSCFVSNQTIAPRDKCRLVAVRQSHTYQPILVREEEGRSEHYGIANNTCHANAFWQPVTPFIAAVYDDFGCVQLVDNPTNKTKVLKFFEEVLSDCPDVESGDSPIHDPAFSFKSFLEAEAPEILAAISGKPESLTNVTAKMLQLCWDHVFRVAQVHRLFMSHAGAVRPLTFAVIHEHTFEALANLLATSTTRCNESLEPRAYILRVLETAFKEAGERPDQASNPRLKGFYLGDRLVNLFNHVGGDGYTNDIDSDMLREAGDALAGGDMSQEQFVIAYMPLLLERYAFAGIERLNAKFTPMIYAGQDNDNSIGQEFASFIAGVSKAVTRSRKEEQYGSFRSYEALFENLDQLHQLPKFLREFDAAVDNIVVSPASGSPDIPAAFECTLSLARLRKALKDLPSSGTILASLRENARARP